MLFRSDVAKKLIGRYPVKELIETARFCMFDDEFASIDGIGPEKSAKFIDWFMGEADRRLRKVSCRGNCEGESVRDGQSCEGTGTG